MHHLRRPGRNEGRSVATSVLAHRTGTTLSGRDGGGGSQERGFRRNGLRRHRIRTAAAALRAPPGSFFFELSLHLAAGRRAVPSAPRWHVRAIAALDGRGFARRRVAAPGGAAPRRV